MRRSPAFALALCVQLFPSVAARAQAPTTVESTGELKMPWTVEIRPSAKAVPIGSCQLVYIELTDETGKDKARKPGGMLVGLADFDWSATGEQTKSAVGLYSGSSAWSVCACQTATIGSSVTITATYPARLLADKLRVPGLAFRSTTQIPIIKSYGTLNPKGCDAQPVAPVAVAPTPVPIGTVLPPTMTALPGSTVPPSARPVAAAPAAPGPTPPSGIATPPANAPPGPAPNSINVSNGAAEAVVTWYAPSTYSTAAPVSYIVDRVLQSNPATIAGQSPSLTVREWHDTRVLAGTWIYRVTAVYADGRRGTTEVAYTYTDPPAPKIILAEQIGRDTVSISWEPVMGAAYYLVAALPTMSSIRADSTHMRRAGVPLGIGTWQVTAVYAGAGSAAPTRSGPAASVTVDVVQRRYRFVAESFRVAAETVDQPLSGDGKFDEVYVAAFAERLDRPNGSRIDISPVQVSAVHGDISNWPPPQRVKAGTASGWGGIHQGDVISPVWSQPAPQAPLGAPQFVLWEGEIVGGKQDLLLHPLVVEVDEPDYTRARVIPEPYQLCGELLCAWYRYLTGPGTKSTSLPTVKAAIASSQLSVQPGVKVWLTASSYLVHLEHMDRDRPIGLEVESDAAKYVGLVGMWRDLVVVLSREKIEAALASGQNKIEVRFWDHTNLTNTPPATISYLNGDYTLVIRMERAP